MSELDWLSEQMDAVSRRMIRERSFDGYAEYSGMKPIDFASWIQSFSLVGDFGAGKLDLAEDDRVGETKIISLDLSKEVGFSNFVQARGERLPFSDESFDAVVSCMGLVFYAQSRAGLVEQVCELNRVLKPGGEMIVNTQIGVDDIKPKYTEDELLGINDFTVRDLNREHTFSANIPGILSTGGFDELDRRVVPENISVLALHLRKRTN